MERCKFCHNDSVENQCCIHCGRFFGSFRVVFIKSLNYFHMTVTDKYLLFHDSLGVSGDMVASAVGGLVGSAIYRASNKKKNESRIGLLDLRSIERIDVLFPESKLQGGAIHAYFKNGTDLILGVFESGSQKINLPNVIDAFKAAGLTINVQNVKSLPIPAKFKMNNPIAKKPKQLLLTVSRSATSFIQPFNKMIVID